MADEMDLREARQLIRGQAGLYRAFARMEALLGAVDRAERESKALESQAAARRKELADLDRKAEQLRGVVEALEAGSLKAEQAAKRAHQERLDGLERDWTSRRSAVLAQHQQRLTELDREHAEKRAEIRRQTEAALAEAAQATAEAAARRDRAIREAEQAEAEGRKRLGQLQEAVAAAERLLTDVRGQIRGLAEAAGKAAT